MEGTKISGKFYKVKGILSMYILKRKINQITEKRNTIIQFSPPRSGSTLVTNILKEILPEKKILKQHNYIEQSESSKIPVVVTYRHPLDCIASAIQAYKLNPTDKVIKERIISLEKCGIWDVLKIKHNPNVLMLRYEYFVDDFEIIYSELERFFQIKISQEKRRDVTKRYQISEVENRIEKMNLSSFNEYDKASLWHGNHISKYKGKPFYYQDFFTNQQIDYMKSIYSEWLLELNYINVAESKKEEK